MDNLRKLLGENKLILLIGFILALLVIELYIFVGIVYDTLKANQQLKDRAWELTQELQKCERSSNYTK
jgi:cell division protein FtsB